MNDQPDGAWPPIPPGSEPEAPAESTWGQNPSGEPPSAEPRSAEPPVSTWGQNPSGEPPSAEPQASTWGQNYKPESEPPDAAGAAYGGSGATGRTPRAVRPIRGPKFSGGGIPGGLGILALLITIVIMALMGAKIFSAMSGDAKTSPSRDNSDDVVLPGGLVVPGDTDTGGDSFDPRSGPAAADAARSQACQVDGATLQTAIAAFEAITGGLPTDQQALVEEQILKAPIASHTFRIVNGEAVVEGTGECA